VRLSANKYSFFNDWFCLFAYNNIFTKAAGDSFTLASSHCLINLLLLLFFFFHFLFRFFLLAVETLQIIFYQYLACLRINCHSCHG